MNGYQTLRFRITGVSALVVHNGRLADPLDEHVKVMAQIAGTRKKTEADHRRLAEIEFKASLYLSDGRPCIPEEVMEAAIAKAAGLQRRAQKAKAGLVVSRSLLLEYDGPKNPDGLWADGRFELRCGVRVGTARIMRTRPRFNEWQADLDVDYLPHIVNPQDVATFLAIAGEQVGIGDWRPKHGRFIAEPLPAAGRSV